MIKVNFLDQEITDKNVKRFSALTTNQKQILCTNCSANYSGVSLSGFPDNETPNIVFRYPDKTYPESRGSRYPEN
jgi:hypothetical protein